MGFLRRKTAASEPELVEASAPIDATAIGQLHPRIPVTVVGEVSRVMVRPTNGHPAFAIAVRDSTGSVTAVWTGRRSIGGVCLGRTMAISGVACVRGDHLEFNNPSYTLLP
jgi:hypothetical protein